MDMQNKITFDCAGNNEATTLCRSDSCGQCAVMCFNSECSCHDIHRNCITSIPVEQFLNSLRNKGSSYMPVLDCLFKAYDQEIKRATTEIEALRDLIAEKSLCLRTNEASLYQQMKMKNTEAIRSCNVARVVTGLEREPVLDPRHRLEGVKEAFESNKEVVEQRYKQLRELWKSGEIFDQMMEKPYFGLRPKTLIPELGKQQVVPNQNAPIQQPPHLPQKDAIREPMKMNKVHSSNSFVFSPEVLQNGFKITDKGRLMKVSTELQHTYALMVPLLTSEDNAVSIHNFMITKCSPSSSIMFGVGCGRSIEKCNYRYHGYGFDIVGYFVNSYNGQVFSSVENKQGESRASNLKKIEVNDVVQIEYNPGRKRIGFENKTKQKSASTAMELPLEDVHHLCVIMSHPGDEVEYLGKES